MSPQTARHLAVPLVVAAMAALGVGCVQLEDGAADATGPVTIAARVRFRAVPPLLLRKLGLERFVPDVSVFDLASASLTVPVAGAER